MAYDNAFQRGGHDFRRKETMKLDRNINPDGRGKYALLKLRELDNIDPKLDLDVDGAMETLEAAGILDWGNTPESEFFLLRIKDRYAGAALTSYADAAHIDGETEYAAEVSEMADRAGPKSPFCKKPD